MPSILNVDTIADNAGTGPVTLTKQSAAKAWCSIDGDASTPVFFDSFNGSSLTDNATGKYTMNLTNNLSNATPSVAGLSGNAAYAGTYTTSSIQHLAGYPSSTAGGVNFYDYSWGAMQAQGDLA